MFACSLFSVSDPEEFLFFGLLLEPLLEGNNLHDLGLIINVVCFPDANKIWSKYLIT